MLHLVFFYLVCITAFFMRSFLACHGLYYLMNKCRLPCKRHEVHFIKQIEHHLNQVCFVPVWEHVPPL